MVDALREENPPKARLVFRVGVTGHLELPDDASPEGAAINAVIGAVLDQITAEVGKIAPEFAGSLSNKLTGRSKKPERGPSTNPVGRRRGSKSGGFGHATGLPRVRGAALS